MLGVSTILLCNLILFAGRGVRDIGYVVADRFVPVPEMIPHLIVPDLKDFMVSSCDVLPSFNWCIALYLVCGQARYKFGCLQFCLLYSYKCNKYKDK